ncbi:MAG: DUF3592 domain-containing protein [Acidobacteriaceae bacterium]
MGGLILDIWVAFLIRTLANGFRRFRSRKWPTAKARVFSAYATGSGGFGCAVTTVSYDYRVGDEKYSGTYDWPCLSHSAAEDDAKIYPKGKEITVLYNPNDPSRSVALL